MRSLFLQIGAITLMNLKSIPQRLWLSLSTVVAIALVVVVLLTFLAMANGFQRTLAGSGAGDVAVILRGGSQSEINSAIAREQVDAIEPPPRRDFEVVVRPARRRTTPNFQVERRALPRRV